MKLLGAVTILVLLLAPTAVNGSCFKATDSVGVKEIQDG
jgi:hypothetical protein